MSGLLASSGCHGTSPEIDARLRAVERQRRAHKTLAERIWRRLRSIRRAITMFSSIIRRPSANDCCCAKVPNRLSLFIHRRRPRRAASALVLGWRPLACVRGSAKPPLYRSGSAGDAFDRFIPALALLIAACPVVSAQTSPPKTPAAPPAKPYKTIAILCRRRCPIRASTPCATSSPKRPNARTARRWRGWLWGKDFSGTAKTATAPTSTNPASTIWRPCSGSTIMKASAGTLLATYADDPAASASPDHKAALCSPADPAFNVKDLDDLTDATDTDLVRLGLSDCRRASRCGRTASQRAGVDKLGLYFVRVLPDAMPPRPPSFTSPCRTAKPAMSRSTPSRQWAMTRFVSSRTAATGKSAAILAAASRNEPVRDPVPRRLACARCGAAFDCGT